MFHALVDIGGYKKGDVVPDEKGKIWLVMYSVPQVVEMKEETSAPAPQPVAAHSDVKSEKKRK